MSDQPLHIALTFDDGFWAPAYATMRSICLTSPRRRDLVFHLIYWELSQSHRADLEEIEREFGATLIDHDLTKDTELRTFAATLPHSRSLPPIIYARIYLERFIPETASRFLYIDCDVFVRRPIENLFAIDLAGKPLGAAIEPGRLHLIAGDDLKGNGKPFDSADLCFNSGVLLIDRKKWVETNVPEKLRQYAASGLMDRLYMDQDMLNYVFRNNWFELDPLWNLTKPSLAMRALDPYIVHYTTGFKPWRSFAPVLFVSTYRHVMTRNLHRRYRNYRWKRRLGALLRHPGNWLKKGKPDV